MMILMIFVLLLLAVYAFRIMKRALKNGTAPTCTSEVHDFVNKCVDDEFVLTPGVKQLPVHRHLASLQQATIL